MLPQWLKTFNSRLRVVYHAARGSRPRVHDPVTKAVCASVCTAAPRRQNIFAHKGRACAKVNRTLPDAITVTGIFE